MTTLRSLLHQYRTAAKTEWEKGTYFELLIQCYLKTEPSYADLYSDVWMYADWAKAEGLNAQDAGIDLVAETRTGELHAVQCKLYAEDYRLQKADIDSFFTASDKKTFSHRIIVSTTANWSAPAEDALRDQNPPVTKIDLNDLEASQIDWSRYQPTEPAPLKAKKLPRPHQESAVTPEVNGKEIKSPFGKGGRMQRIQGGGDDKWFRVEKMCYAKTKIDGKSRDDKTILIYNDHITLRDIPLEAYGYIVNGKSALDWVEERQCIKTDKASGIVNDANDWAVETMGNAKYPLARFMRVITVSLETMKIVNGLPGLEI